MTLSCENPWSKRTFGPGIFVSEATVAGIEDISGQPLPFRDQPCDIGIKLTLNIGRDFQPALIIAGDFKRDVNTSEVTGWGGAFTVQEALSRLGFNGALDENNHIPPNILPNLVGQKIYRLSYVTGLKDNGKPRYSDWVQIGTLEEGADELVRRFKRSLSKGYPRNYRPTVLEEEHTEVEAGSADDSF